MNTKTYLVTNRGEGSISLVGRSRIRIPGDCVDCPIILSAEKAQATNSRLKRTYPLLKIVEKAAPGEQASPTQESKNSTPQSAVTSTPETDKPQEGTVTSGQGAATQTAQAPQSGTRKK